MVGRLKAQHFCELAKKAKGAVSIDSIETTECISAEVIRQGAPIDVLTEANVGINWVGVETPELLVSLPKR